MHLKRLEIHGFKSFAHKSVLEFDPGITAVVGPNGSGKSNVADSIRWVMGEQSMKLLRGKKSEDVIFAGSDKKSKLSVAEVGLLFDNRDHKLPFEYSEVEIRRRIYRDGESDYLVNGSKVRLLDIVDALIRSGFGGSNYSVIGQGMIDQMVLAGPAEIKNLIEEAAGVKPYYTKREKTMRRLDQTEENLTQVSQLLNEIEPRLKSLKRQAKRMQEREAVALELKGLNLKYFGNQYAILNNELDAVNENASLKQKEIAELEEKIGQFQKVLEKEEQENRKNSNFTYELSKKIDGLEQRRFKLQEDLAEIRGKLKSGLVPGSFDPENLKLQRLEMQRELETREAKLKQLNSKLVLDEAGLKKLNDQVEKIAEKITQARDSKIDVSLWQKELEQFRLEFLDTLESLSISNIDESKERLKAILSKLTESKQLKAMTAEDVASLQSRKDSLVAELHQLELRVVEQRTVKARYMEEIESQTLKFNQVKSLLDDSAGSFEHELTNQEQALSKQLAEILKQIDESKSTLENLSSKEKQRKGFLVDEEKTYRKQAAQLAVLKDEINRMLVDKARVETRLEGLFKEAKDNGIEPADLKQHAEIEVEADLINRIEKLKHQLEMAGGVDEQVLAEYRETEERFNYLSTQSTDLTSAMKDLNQVVDELDTVIKEQFDEGFHKISEKFSEYFRILFNGGRAHMNLLREIVEEESLEEKEEGEAAAEEDKPKTGSKQIVGVEIKATPPGKKLASIAALSGGERALT
ncbi:MAG: chromosome segregation SMC family protein, partial [Acidobacteriaceae bacterium]